MWDVYHVLIYVYIGITDDSFFRFYYKLFSALLSPNMASGPVYSYAYGQIRYDSPCRQSDMLYFFSTSGHMPTPAGVKF